MEKWKVPTIRDVVDVKTGEKYDVGDGSTPAPKNKFSAKWLSDTEKDANGEAYSVYIRKHKKDGFAWCEYCQSAINYGTAGKKSLFQHSTMSKHKDAKSVKKNSVLLPAAFRATQGRINCENPDEQEDNPGPAMPPKPVTLADRVSHQEATICSFIAEHSLPLSLGPHLLELSTELSMDNAAQQKLYMQRSSITYKLKHGLAEVEHYRLVAEMKCRPFSLNLDESTSKGNKKRVLNVLVCFFSEELKRSVTQLYCAVELTIVSGETVFEAVMDKMRSDNIPLKNLVSILTDSAAYMKGINRGFHTKMKTVAPHLLDIDGDVCHHIHNISKKFSSELDPENVLPKLLDDIYRDFDLSADLKKDLLDMCELLGVTPLHPYQRASHRWMSLFDSSQRFLELLKPLTMFYFAWLSVEDKQEFKGLTSEILAGTSKENRGHVFDILRRLKGKGLTSLGKARKARITAKLFKQRTKVLLLAHTVTSVFPKFKQFILMFQQESPLVHKLSDKVIELLKDFLGYFMKHEVLNASANLTKANHMKKENLLPLNDIFSCSAVRKLLQHEPARKKPFLTLLLNAYQRTAEYMKEKLPHRNKLLHHLSCLDPSLHGHSAAATGLKALCDYFPTLLKEEDKDSFHSAVNALNLSVVTTDDHELDKWWQRALERDESVVLKPIIHACLSIFTGPRVEASFSLMNNIITSTTNRMNIDTYEAYLKHKYWLLAHKRTTVQAFHRKDPVYSPVDKSLVYYMQTAYTRSTTSKRKNNPFKTFSIPKKRVLEGSQEIRESKKPKTVDPSSSAPPAPSSSAPPVPSSSAPPAPSSAAPPAPSSSAPPAPSSAAPPAPSSAAPPAPSSAAPPAPSSVAPPAPSSAAPPHFSSSAPPHSSSALPVSKKKATDIRSFFSRQK